MGGFAQSFSCPTSNYIEVRLPLSWGCDNSMKYIAKILSNSSPSSSVQSKSDKALTLFFPCHKKKKNKKNPHQNLPEQSVLQTSPTIPGFVYHHPKDSHPSKSTRSLTLAQSSLLFHTDMITGNNIAYFCSCSASRNFLAETSCQIAYQN